MATPAGHHLASREIVLIDSRHHGHHSPRDHFSLRIRCPIYAVGTGAGMTFRTVKAQRSRHNPHGPHEIVHGNSPQHLDIMERLFRQLRLRGRGGLATNDTSASHPHNRNSSDREDDSLRPEIHVLKKLSVHFFSPPASSGAPVPVAPMNSFCPLGRVMSLPLARFDPSLD